MKVAVSGVAHWHTPLHLGALAKTDAALVGVSDDDPAIAERIAHEHHTRAFTNLSAMTATTVPDLVIAMGTPKRALESARLLVEMGTPCVVEKPIGLDGGELTNLVKAAHARGAFVSVPLVNRYSELWRRLSELQDSARAGALLHASFRVVNGPPERYRTMGVAWMLDPEVSGGGCLRNLGIHGVDAFVQLAGPEPVEVVSCVLDRRRQDVAIETYAVATLRSAAGAIGTIETGYTFAAPRGGDTEWRVSTANSYLVDRNQTLRVLTLDDERDVRTQIPSVAERYDRYIADTIRRVSAGEPPSIPLAEYHRATCLIDEIYASAGSLLPIGRP